jgi:bile acid-coenzyme A ligase
MSRMLKAAAELPTRPALASLDGMLHLGGVCPAYVKRAWIEWIGADRVWELYAGTEAQFMTFIRGDEWLTHPGSVGRVPPGRVAILDSSGEALPPATVGEIWMRTPRNPTYRYIGADRRAREGWESLGDLGSVDEDGYLYIADRRNDLIISGGANVYPAEVESALDEHPEVISCVVVGRPDDDLGQRVHAIVQLQQEVSDQELRGFLQDRLARYKIPRTFERSEHQVRDDGGKVRRAAFAGSGDTHRDGQ